MHDEFYTYDIANDVVNFLEIEGYTGEYRSHGISLLDDDADHIYINAVNHGRTGSNILQFRHRLGSGKVTFIRAFDHNLINTPNDVIFVSPDEFYFTNDHTHRSGLRREFEDKFGPWIVAGGVGHCKLVGTELQCGMMQQVLSSPNGIQRIMGQNKIAVADHARGLVAIFDRAPATGALNLTQVVRVGSLLDNINPMPNGDLIVSGFPDPEAFALKFSNNNVMNASVTLPAAAFILRKDKAWQAELLFWTHGPLIQFMTTSQVLAGTRTFLGISHWAGNSLIRCELDA